MRLALCYGSRVCGGICAGLEKVLCNNLTGTQGGFYWYGDHAGSPEDFQVTGAIPALSILQQTVLEVCFDSLPSNGGALKKQLSIKQMTYSGTVVIA